MEGNSVEVFNPTNGSHTMLALGLALAIPTGLSFLLAVGVGFYMLPLGVIGVGLIIASLYSKHVRKTEINLEKRTVDFFYSSLWSKNASTETLPLASFSMIMLEFSRPKTKTPGEISVSLSGRGGHVNIFNFPVMYGTLAAADSYMPKIREAVRKIGEIVGLKAILDHPPLTSRSSGMSASSAVQRPLS